MSNYKPGAGFSTTAEPGELPNLEGPPPTKHIFAYKKGDTVYKAVITWSEEDGYAIVLDKVKGGTWVPATSLAMKRSLLAAYIVQKELGDLGANS